MKKAQLLAYVHKERSNYRISKLHIFSTIFCWTNNLARIFHLSNWVDCRSPNYSKCRRQVISSRNWFQQVGFNSPPQNPKTSNQPTYYTFFLAKISKSNKITTRSSEILIGSSEISSNQVRFSPNLAKSHQFPIVFHHFLSLFQIYNFDQPARHPLEV